MRSKALDPRLRGDDELISGSLSASVEITQGGNQIGEALALHGDMSA